MIFASNAPRYWAAGLPVIPIRQGEKRPSILGWQRFGDRMPDDAEQRLWLADYASGNIGLPLGPCSGLVAVDIDSTDQRVLAAIKAVLPTSPWERIGKKGMVLIYRFRNHITIRIKDQDERSVCEILSRGTQIVIPPSIHPDTGKPYWANVELISVLDRVPVLPPDADVLIRGALGDIGISVSKRTRPGVTDFVPAGARDNALVGQAGLFAYAVTRGEKNLLQAIREVRVWAESFPEKIIGDPMSPDKAQQKLVEFLINDVMGPKKKTLPVGWDDGLDREDKQKLGVDFSDDQLQWDHAKIKTYLDEFICTITDMTSISARNTVEFILGRIANSRDMSSIDEDMFLRTIHDASGRIYTMAAMRKKLKSLKGTGIEGTDHTQIAHATLHDLDGSGELRYEAGRFWQWDGSHWKAYDDIRVRQHVMENYGKMPAATKENDHRSVERAIRTLVTKPLKSLDVKGINFANGFLTTDLQLLPHNPDYGCTYMLPYRYVPEIWDRCSLWTTFLYDVWGEDEDYEQKVLCLQEVMAATLFGLGPSYEKALCLIGVPGSGKSRVMNLMIRLMPPGSRSAINPGEWADKYAPAEMFGKMLNIAGELSGSRKINSRAFKSIMDGQPISAQRKNQPLFEFQPMCTHWFCSNHMPTTDDTDFGFSRRWLFLQFNRPVPEEKRIENFENVLFEAEREEIISWAVQGIVRLQERHGYTVPISARRLEEELKRKINSAHYFLRACPKILVGRARHVDFPPQRIDRILATDLYHEYQSFCIGHVSAKPATLPRFKDMMHNLQSDFGFLIKNQVQLSGYEEVAYQFITLAEKRAGIR